MIIGYDRYGPEWAEMKRDSELNPGLKRRKNTQLKDRWRNLKAARIAQAREAIAKAKKSGEPVVKAEPESEALAAAPPAASPDSSVPNEVQI